MGGKIGGGGGGVVGNPVPFGPGMNRGTTMQEAPTVQPAIAGAATTAAGGANPGGPAPTAGNNPARSPGAKRSASPN